MNIIHRDTRLPLPAQVAAAIAEYHTWSMGGGITRRVLLDEFAETPAVEIDRALDAALADGRIEQFEELGLKRLRPSSAALAALRPS